MLRDSGLKIRHSRSALGDPGVQPEIAGIIPGQESRTDVGAKDTCPPVTGSVASQPPRKPPIGGVRPDPDNSIGVSFPEEYRLPIFKDEIDAIGWEDGANDTGNGCRGRSATRA